MKYGNSTLMFQQGRNEMLKTRSLKRGFPFLGNHTETPSFQHVSRWFPWRKLRHSAKFPVWGNDYARWNFIEKYKTIYINNKKSNFWADFQVYIFFLRREETRSTCWTESMRSWLRMQICCPEKVVPKPTLF